MAAQTGQIMTLADALSKTESFDADLRFMGLSDLQSLLLQDGSQISGSPQVRKAVIDLLGDSITEVQNQAIKTLGPLVSVGSESTIEAIITGISEKDSLTGAVKSLAYRAILADTPHNATSLTAKLMLEKLSAIETVDDLDVVIDLLRTLASSLSSGQVATLLSPVIGLLRSGSDSLGSGLQRLRAFEAMKLGIPLVAQVDSVWESILEFFGQLVSSTSRPELMTGALQLASWLPASRVSSERLISLWGTIGPQVKEILSRTPSDDENVDGCESALMVLTAWNSKMLFEDPSWVLEIATRFIEWDALYTRSDQPMDPDERLDSNPAEDEFMSDGDDGDFSDVDDNSFRVRRWTANLVGTFSSYPELAPKAVAITLSALANERDESVRNSLYACLSLLPNVQPESVITLIERDPYNSSALELLLKLGPLITPSMAERVTKIAKIASSRRSLLRIALELVKINGKSSDEATSAIVLKGLTSSDYSIQVLSLETARVAGNRVFTIEALKFARTAADSSLLSLALITATEICSADLAPEVLDVLVQLILRVPPSRAIAASSLNVLLGRDLLPKPLILRAVESLCEALEMQPPLSAAVCCYQCLSSAGAKLGPSEAVVRAVFSGPSDVDHQAEALCSQAADPAVQQWLLSLPSLPLVEDGGVLALAAECCKVNPGLLTGLQERGASARIIAASIIAAGIKNINVGDNLRLVAALAFQGYPTLSVAEVLSVANSTPIAADPEVLVDTLGKVASLDAGQLQILISTAEPSLSDDVRTKALSVAISARPEYGDIVWQAIQNGSQHDSPYVSYILARLIIADGSANKLSGFSTQIRVATIQRALPEVQTAELAKELLELLILALSDDSPSRSQAPTTIAWALQTISRSSLTLKVVEPLLPRIVHGICETANARDPAQIRIVQIGPFKHKVDDQLPLRQAAFEAFYSMMPLIESYLTPEVAQSIVAGLTDTENDIKILACQVLPLLYKAAPHLLDPYMPQIEAAFESELDKKIKETVGKQVHDKHDSLIRAVQDAKLALFAEGDSR